MVFSGSAQVPNINTSPEPPVQEETNGSLYNETEYFQRTVTSGQIESAISSFFREMWFIGELDLGLCTQFGIMTVFHHN